MIVGGGGLGGEPPGNNLEVFSPHAVWTVVWLTMTPELYAVLEMTGVLGMQMGGGRPRGNTTW